MVSARFIACASLAALWISASPARAQQSAASQPPRENSADLVSRADALMTEADQIGRRADQLESTISGGSSAAAMASMPPEKAAAAASSGKGGGFDKKKAAISNAISEMRSHQMSDWSDAEKLYKQALAASPENADLRVKHARPLGYLGKFDQQTQELRAAAALEPKNAAIASELGDAYYDHKNWDGAETQYKEAIRLEPGNALYHFDLGSVYLQRKNWSAAETEARQATTLEPGNDMYQRLFDNAQKHQTKNHE